VKPEQANSDTGRGEPAGRRDSLTVIHQHIVEGWGRPRQTADPAGGAGADITR
jgi:hypothetical protein